MTNEQSDISRGEKPPKNDDLQLIKGIGPVIEHRLHGVGTYTYAQLAAKSPADIAAAVLGLQGLTAESIKTQDWIGQARKLASKSISSETHGEVEAPAEPVVPPIVSQVELVAPAAEKTESVPPVVAEPELAAPAVEVTEPAPPVVAPPDAKEAHIPPPVVAMIGTPRLSQIETVSADAHIPQNFFVRDQPFNVNLTLDLSNVRHGSNPCDKIEQSGGESRIAQSSQPSGI